MSDIILTITQPAHDGAAFSGPVNLTGTVNYTSGLFFKWYSSLYAEATKDQPEMNADHSGAGLALTPGMLTEFGTHVVTLAATDNEQPVQVRRAAMTGGAPPQSKAPCVVHQVNGVSIHLPKDGDTLSKTAATIQVLPPGAWFMPDPADSTKWIANQAYRQINGVALSVMLAPDGAADPAHSAQFVLDLPGLALATDGDGVWLEWAGALPTNLGTGAYVLSLIASAGSASATVTRHIVLGA